MNPAAIAIVWPAGPMAWCLVAPPNRGMKALRLSLG